MAFLSDRLESIHNSDIPKKDRNIKIIEELKNEIPNANKVGINAFISKLKSIEYSYQLFVKKHPEYNESFFRNFVCKDRDTYDEHTKETLKIIRKVLNWN